MSTERENQTRNPFLAANPQQHTLSIHTHARNPFASKMEYSPHLFKLKKLKENQLDKELQEFMPIIEEWNAYLFDIITQGFTQDQRSDGFELIENKLIAYEKKYPRIYMHLCDTQNNHTDEEKAIFIVMQQIKSFDELAPLNFDQNFLKKVRKRLLWLSHNIDNNMELFLRHQKALEDYLYSYSITSTIENTIIVINSISGIEDFLNAFLQALASEKIHLICYIQQANQYLSNDPIANYISTTLTELLQYVEENLGLVSDFNNLCIQKNQELKMTLQKMQESHKQEQFDFDFESPSSSSGI